MAQDLRAFMVSEAANFEAAVYETEYEAIQYTRLVPVVTEGNQWALSVERRTMDTTGEAKRLSHLAEDWPDTDSLYSRLTHLVSTYGSSYTVAEDEAAIAMMGGFNLSTDKARAARRVVEKELDKLFRDGDNKADRGEPFYLSSLGATAVGQAFTAVTTDAHVRTVMTMVNAGIAAVYNGTKAIHTPDTLAISYDRFAALAAAQVPNTTMTLLEWLRMNNAYTAQTGQQLTIIGTGAIKTATTGLLYKRHPDVLRYHLPMPINVRGPQMANFGLTMKYGVLCRTGGLEWRIPSAAHRLTGI